jgi:hypothetical protein
MGIDWFRMRPKQGASRQELLALRDRQAASFYACGFGRIGWMQEYDAPLFASDHPVAQEYRDSKRALMALLDIPNWAAEQGFAVCYRVYPITSNYLFPIEWAQAAYRTIFPDELPPQLAQWQDHVDRVRAGQYRAYFLQRYLYEISLYLYREWYYLRQRAEQTHGRTNAWAKRPAFLRTRAEIVMLPPPMLQIAPLWAYWQHQPAAPPGDLEEAYAEQEAYKRLLLHLKRQWDGHVPGTWKRQDYYSAPYKSLEDYRAHFADCFAWTDKFLTWAQRCCDAEMGLYLDY